MIIDKDKTKDHSFLGEACKFHNKYDDRRNNNSVFQLIASDRKEEWNILLSRWNAKWYRTKFFRIHLHITVPCLCADISVSNEEEEEEARQQSRKRRSIVYSLQQTRKGKGEFRLYKQLVDHGLKFYKYFEIARYFYNRVIRLYAVFAANFLRCKKERHTRTGHVQIRSHLQIHTMTMFCQAEKIPESTKSVRDTNNSERDTSDVLNCYI